MEKTHFTLTLIILLIPLYLYGQEFAKTGTAGAQFLKIGVGARGIAMSDAYGAVCNDVTSIFWNPAGLTKITNTSMMFSHAEWLADINYEAIAIAKTFNNIGTIGLSITYLSSGEIEETTVEMQDGTGRMFDTGDLMIGLSFARQMIDRFSIGGNLKYIQERLDTEKAWAWAIDMGTLYWTGFHSLRIGMYIRNFGPELKIKGTYVDLDDGNPVLDPDTQEPEQKSYLPYHMPMTFSAGIAYDVLENENRKLTLAMDLVHPNDNVERLNIGGEFTLFKTLSLRGGYISPFGVLGRYDTEVENREQRNEYSLETMNYTQTFSVGVGLQLYVPSLGNLSIDYAYTDFGVLDWAHRASILINH